MQQGSNASGNQAGPTRSVSENFGSTNNRDVNGNANEKEHNERQADKFVGTLSNRYLQEYRKLMESTTKGSKRSIKSRLLP